MPERMRRQAVETDRRGSLVENRALEGARPHRCAYLLAAEDQRITSPPGEVGRQFIDEEPRDGYLAALVVLGIARHDMAINDHIGPDNGRAAPHQVEAIDAQPGQ